MRSKYRILQTNLKLNEKDYLNVQMQISLNRTDLKLSFSGLFFAEFFVPGDITFYIRTVTVSCYGLCSVVFFRSRELHGREGKA